MANEVTVKIKFRDVTIENMTLDEVKELRDILDKVCGPKPQPVKVIEREVYHPYQWHWQPLGYWTVSDNTANLAFTDVTGSASTNTLTIDCVARN